MSGRQFAEASSDFTLCVYIYVCVCMCVGVVFVR